MPNILRNLHINRVASVDKGAGEGVQIVLMKRDFNTKERQHMAGTGQAMPDGSFPIANEEDLHNAIRAIGRAKDPAAAKKHIIARARSMGMTSALPDDWKVSKEAHETEKKLTFEQRKDGTTRFWHEQDPTGQVEEPGEGESGLDNSKEPKKASSVLHRAIKVLKQSLESIFGGAEVEQELLLEKTINEFETHVQSAVTASDDDNTAIEAASGNGDNGGGINKKDTEMTEAEVLALKKANEDLKLELALARLSPAEQDFAKAMTPEEKGKFCAKDDKARKDEMEAKAKSAAELVPDAVKKALAEAEVTKAANEALAKRVAELEAKDETVALTKRATEIGLSAADVDTLRKARKGDLEAVRKLEDKIGALTKQVREAGLFRELGNGSTVGGSAYDQINAKAEELRKADPKLTQPQAFEKAYMDPANVVLVQAYKREKSASI